MSEGKDRIEEFQKLVMRFSQNSREFSINEFITLFNSEVNYKLKMRQEYNPDIELIDLIVKCYEKAKVLFAEKSLQFKNEICNYIFIVLMDAVNYDKGEEYIVKIYSSMSKNLELITEFLKKHQDKNEIHNSYLIYTKYLIENCSDLKTYFETIDFVTNVSPRYMEFLKYKFTSKAEDIFLNSKNMVDDFIFVNTRFELLEEHYIDKGVEDVFTNIKTGIFEKFIDSIKPENMSIEELNKVVLLKPYVGNENYEVLDILKLVTEIKSFDDAATVGRYIKNSAYRIKIKSIIRSKYKKHINSENYLKILCAFLNDDGCDIDGVFKFVYSNGKIVEARKFVIWICSMHEKLFSKEFFNKIRRALINYFENLDTKFFQDRKAVQKIKKESRNEMRQFLIEEEYKMASGFKKLGIKLTRIVKKK